LRLLGYKIAASASLCDEIAVPENKKNAPKISFNANALVAVDGWLDMRQTKNQQNSSALSILKIWLVALYVVYCPFSQGKLPEFTHVLRWVFFDN